MFPNVTFQLKNLYGLSETTEITEIMRQHKIARDGLVASIIKKRKMVFNGGYSMMGSSPFLIWRDSWWCGYEVS